MNVSNVALLTSIPLFAVDAVTMRWKTRFSHPPYVLIWSTYQWIVPSVAAGVNAVEYAIERAGMRSGSATGLRGQVMRLVGSILDPYFLLR